LQVRVLLGSPSFIIAIVLHYPPSIQTLCGRGFPYRQHGRSLAINRRSAVGSLTRRLSQGLDLPPPAADFMVDLRALTAQSAKMLEVGVLTCVRTIEIVQMQWSQIDWKKGRWVIPGKVDEERLGSRHPPDRRPEWKRPRGRLMPRAAIPDKQKILGDQISPVFR
jgi:integrase